MGKKLGTLVVVVIRAKNLVNKQRIGKQDPYCSVTLNTHKKRTKTVRKGGQTPEWDEELRFEVWQDQADEVKAEVTASGGVKPILDDTTSSSSSKNKETAARLIKSGPGANAKMLFVAVYADDPKDPDLVGEGQVDLTDTLKKGEFDDWVPLQNKGRFTGEVYLEMTFYAEGPEPPRRQKKAPSQNYSGPGEFEPLTTSSLMKPTSGATLASSNSRVDLSSIPAHLIPGSHQRNSSVASGTSTLLSVGDASSLQSSTNYSAGMTEFGRLDQRPTSSLYLTDQSQSQHFASHGRRASFSGLSAPPVSVISNGRVSPGASMHGQGHQRTDSFPLPYNQPQPPPRPISAQYTSNPTDVPRPVSSNGHAKPLPVPVTPQYGAMPMSHSYGALPSPAQPLRTSTSAYNLSSFAHALPSPSPQPVPPPPHVSAGYPTQTFQEQSSYNTTPFASQQHDYTPAPQYHVQQSHSPVPVAGSYGNQPPFPSSASYQNMYSPPPPSHEQQSFQPTSANDQAYYQTSYSPAPSGQGQYQNAYTTPNEQPQAYTAPYDQQQQQQHNAYGAPQADNQYTSEPNNSAYYQHHPQSIPPTSNGQAYDGPQNNYALDPRVPHTRPYQQPYSPAPPVSYYNSPQPLGGSQYGFVPTHSGAIPPPVPPRPYATTPQPDAFSAGRNPLPAPPIQQVPQGRPLPVPTGWSTQQHQEYLRSQGHM